MPTDLVALHVRKKQARALVLNNAKLILVCFAINALIIAALFALHGFEQAVILMGKYSG